MRLSVDNPNSVVVWKFQVVDLDIDFSVVELIGDEVIEIHKTTRYEATNQSIQGRHACKHIGTVVLEWNNSYSIVRGKNLLILAEIVANDTMESAFEAADAFAQAASMTGNCLEPIISSTESSSSTLLDSIPYWLTAAKLFSNTETTQDPVVEQLEAGYLERIVSCILGTTR